MKANTLRRLLSLALSAVLALTLALPAAAAGSEPANEPAADDSTVTIFTTNDIHGVVENSETSIGLAQIAGIRASTPNSLLVDAGDATQGASFATVTQGADVIRVMNAAGYDAMAAGNHEFDYGAAQLKANADLADFPILGCNLVGEDGFPLLEECTTIDVAGHTICFIGVTTTATETSTNPKLREGVTFADEAAAVGDLIDTIKFQADAIILVTHMGDNPVVVPCTSAQLLEKLSDSQRAAVTAVIDGHSHTEEKAPVNGIPVLQTGTLCKALGQLTLHFAADGKVTAEEQLLDYAAAMAFPLNADGEAAATQVSQEITAIKAEQEAVLGQALCEAETPLWGGYIYYDYSEPRIVETAYGDFVTDAFASYAGTFAEQQGLDLPIIAVENGGGVSATLPVGTVTQGDVLNAFNHGNLVEVLKVTPAQLYTALEAGLTMTGQDETGLLVREKVSGSFLQVSGFTYAYDPAGVAGSKVTAVTLDDGTALARDDKKTQLLMATNNYVSSFDAFAGAEKLGELGGEDLLVASYLLECTNDGAEPLARLTTAGRIIIENDQSPDTYDVAVPVENAAEDMAGQTVKLRIDDGDAQEYTLDDSSLLALTLPKGPHTLYLEGVETPVYVNNYSGSGTVTTTEWDYRFGFVYEAQQEPEATPEPTAEAAEATPEPTEAPAAEPVQSSGGGMMWLWVLLAVLIVGGIAAVILSKHKKEQK